MFYNNTFLKPVMDMIMSDQCQNTFFVDFDIFNIACLTALLSKALGYSIVLGAVMVKVPQIQKIIAAKSGEGVSFFGLLLELFAYTSMLAYSIAKEFPFSSYGDSFFVMIQTVVLGALMQFYAGKPRNSISYVVGYCAILWVLVCGYTPVEVLAAMQVSNLPVVVVAKSIQIITNYRNGSTGQLSAITIFMIFAGSLARIFTSIQETGDPIIVWTYIIASLANSLLAFQIVWYWNSGVKAKEE